MNSESIYKKRQKKQQLNGLLGLAVIVGFVWYLVSEFRELKNAPFDSWDAISACKRYYIKKGVSFKTLGNDRAEVYGTGWYVVVDVKDGGYRSCSVSSTGLVFNTNY